MSNKTKGKLDAITFIYGFGAAVVLVGAMFKFLGWQFANEMFILGLSIEAIVFLISAFERKTEENEYKWENVFPQLLGGQGDSADTGSYQAAMGQVAKTIESLNQQMADMGKSVEGLKESAAKTAAMQAKIDEFNQLMDTYNGNLRQINDKYNNILKG